MDEAFTALPGPGAPPCIFTPMVLTGTGAKLSKPLIREGTVPPPPGARPGMLDATARDGSVALRSTDGAFLAARYEWQAAVAAHRRKGTEPSQRLGRHRWTVEGTVAWLAGCRRLHRRYQLKAEHFLAFAGIAATLICYRRLGG